MAAQPLALDRLHLGWCACRAQRRSERGRLRRAVVARDVEDQEIRGVGCGDLKGRRQCLLSGGIVAERLHIGVVHEITALGDLARHVIRRPVEQNDAPHRIGLHPGLGEVARIGADQRRQMRTRAMPHQHDAGWVEPQLRGLSAQRGHRIGDVLRLLFDRCGGHEAVIDRGEGIARRERM